MALYALRDAAKLERPHTLGSALLLDNESCIAIFDKYPKAKYHILILPRIPYFHTSSERQLDSLASVLQHNAREIVSAMAEMATEVEEMIVDEMVKTEGFRWGVNVGFHAVPSMRHVHLHLISNDLVSPALKTKKHYNSFRPDLGFFVSLREVQGWIEDGSAETRAKELSMKESLLATSLVCYKCGQPMGNMPKLKEHLDTEMARESSDLVLVKLSK